MKCIRVTPVVGAFACYAAAAYGQTITFNFDNGTPALALGQSTPFAQTTGGVTAQFSSSSVHDFSVQSDVTTQFRLSKFSGNYLNDNDLNRSILTIHFSQSLQAITFPFATADFGVEVPTAIQLTAYRGSTASPVGSATAHGTYGGDTMPMGTLAFNSGQSFNLVEVTIPFQPMGASVFLLDDISVTLASGSSAPVLPASFAVLPQFVAGGGSPGWYSAIYFLNSGDTGVAFPVHFLDNNGQSMAVPVGAGASSPNHTVNIPPRGVAVIEAPNSGTALEGWAALELPATVIANGVFRLSVLGQVDQEAVVPVYANTAKRLVLVFDERDNMRTGVAVTNPTGTAVTVTIATRDEFGQVLGSRTLTLNPYSKSVFFLSEMTQFAAMKGKTGTVEFTTPLGAIAVMGLRARGLAFTSVPSISPN